MQSKNVKLFEYFMEGEHRGETKRISFDEIQSVEVVNRDYRKVLTYYLIGSAVAVVLTLWLLQRVPTG